MVRDFSKRVLLKIRNIFHKQIREGIGLYQYTTWIFLENFVKFLQLFCGTIASNWVWMSYWSINNVFPVEAQFYLKNFFGVFLRNLETFSKKLFAKKISFNWVMFHNAEAARTSLKKISIPGVFLSYGTPESFFNSCFINCY